MEKKFEGNLNRSKFFLRRSFWPMNGS